MQATMDRKIFQHPLDLTFRNNLFIYTCRLKSVFMEHFQIYFVPLHLLIDLLGISRMVNFKGF